MSSENNTLPVLESRRAFLGKCASALAGITVIGCGGILLEGCEATYPTPPGSNNGGGGNNNGTLTLDVSSLDADGKAFVTSQRGPDGKRILIVRNSATEYLALSMSCTHENNEVAPPVNGTITCPFHGSQFDLKGDVKTGPAASPLKRYQATFDDSTKKLTVALA